MNEEGKLNALCENASENYIGVFWGCRQSEISANKLILERFEVRQKERFGLSKEQELKSTIIRPKNYKYGIKSFNKTTLAFYQEFFEILDAINPILQINTISKVEFFIRKVFESVEMPDNYCFKSKVFYYTLTKFIIMYHNSELLISLYTISNYGDVINFIKLLIFNIQCVVDAIKDIERKTQELNAYVQLLKVLNIAKIKMDNSAKYDFAYFVNFEGLSNLLEDKNIKVNKVGLILDQEEDTYCNAKKYPFCFINQADSKEVIQIRFADLLSGFIGHMMNAIDRDLKSKEDKVSDIRKIAENDLSTKRLLSKEWFEVTREQFDLYQILYETLIVPHQEYWTCMTLCYADQSVAFFELIRYFDRYKSYDDFIDVSAEMHSEYYNSSVLRELQSHYSVSYSKREELHI